MSDAWNRTDPRDDVVLYVALRWVGADERAVKAGGGMGSDYAAAVATVLST